MTRHFFFSIVLAVGPSVGVAGQTPTPPDQDSSPLVKKYEGRVAAQSWSWSDEELGLVYSMAHASSPYDLVVVKPQGPSYAPLRLNFRILDGRREVYTWTGGPSSVFILQDERLYFVRPDIRGGASVV